MIIQGSIVVLFISALLFIGNSLKDTTYLRLERDLKSATKRYVRDYNIKPKISDSVIITVDDLCKSAACWNICNYSMLEGHYLSSNNLCIDIDY